MEKPHWRLRDRLNLITHVVPFVLTGFALGGFFLWFALGYSDAAEVPTWFVGLAAYLGFGLFVFGASSVYHAREGQPDEGLFNELDHTAIHVLIAGTGTFHMVVLPFIHIERIPTLVMLLWGIAAAGIVMRWVWTPGRRNRVKDWVQYAIYGVMAATAAFAIEFSAGAFHDTAMLLTFASLTVYSVSVVFFALANRVESRVIREGGSEHDAHLASVGYHSIWHIGTTTAFALGGLAPIL